MEINMLPFKSQKCRLTSPYGYRIHPINGWRHFHGGVDLVSIGGDEVVAAADGKVVRSRIVTDKRDATWEWGEYIAITGTDGITVYYCHLAKRMVQVGANVKAGDVIGIEGATGQATGKHLHFECRHGSKHIDAAEYLGIANKLGTYDGVIVAIDKLAAMGVITSPEYWREHARDIEYLDTLIVRAADKVLTDKTVGGDVLDAPNLEAALSSLVKAGVINTPAYWRNNADKVQYLPDLIRKLGGAV